VRTFSEWWLPLAAPGVAASLVLAFIFCWKQLYLRPDAGGTKYPTGDVGLAEFHGYERGPVGLMAAATVIAIVPEMILALSVHVTCPRPEPWRGEVREQEGTDGKSRASNGS